MSMADMVLVVGGIVINPYQEQVCGLRIRD